MSCGTTDVNALVGGLLRDLAFIQSGKPQMFGYKRAAAAIFRLVTFRPEPLFSVPFFLRCIADFTRLLAAFPYLAMHVTLQTSC